MNTLIVYSSKHGTTSSVAGLIWSRMDKKHTHVTNVLDVHDYKIKHYDTIILGASIHVGKIQPSMLQFIEQYYDLLLQKRLGLFLCCIKEGSAAFKQFDEVFPESLRFHSVSSRIVGGEIKVKRMSLWDRFLVRRRFGFLEDKSTINHDYIKEFVREVSIERSWPLVI